MEIEFDVPIFGTGDELSVRQIRYGFEAEDLSLTVETLWLEFLGYPPETVDQMKAGFLVENPLVSWPNLVHHETWVENPHEEFCN